MNAIKKLTPIMIFILYCNSLISQSIFDVTIQKTDKDIKYMIEQNGRLWSIDTTMITVKLKPIVKTLPENLVALRTNKLGFIDLKIPNNISFLDYVNTLKSYTELFETIEYSTFGEYSAAPNDPMHTNQWHLNSINVFDAWNYTMGRSNVTVAVLDAGLDVNHEDIGNGTDGYNNIATGGWNFEDNTPDVSSVNRHGTLVSGIISAKTNNRKGVSGIGGGNNGTGIKILPINLGDIAPISGILDDAILYAVDKKVRIIQLSLGVTQTVAIDAAIQYAVDNDVLIVCASGNNYNIVNYPASSVNVIAVGAVSANNRRAGFSNYGDKLDIVAPGVSIYSTTLNSTYNLDDGTSFAAPIVSAIAALILSVNPGLTQKEVADVIESTAQKVGGYNYTNSTAHPNGTWNNEMGHGLVDAYEAVKKAKDMYCPTTTLAGTQPPPPSTNKRVVCKEIKLQNVTVPSGATLKLKATGGAITIDANTRFRIEAGARFTVE